MFGVWGFIHSFKKYLLSFCYEPDMNLGIGDTEVIKTCSQGVCHVEKHAINHTRKSNNEIVSNEIVINVMRE